MHTGRCTVLTEITSLAFTLVKILLAGICSKLSRQKSHSRKCCLLYYGRSAGKELKKNNKKLKTLPEAIQVYMLVPNKYALLQVFKALHRY